MAPEISFIPATTAHAEALAPSMRPEDLAEVVAVGYKDALDALVKSVEMSKLAWSALVDGEVVAIFGMVLDEKASPGVGAIWFLTGAEFPKHRYAFARRGRPVVAELLERCGCLANYIDARYTKAVRWARWLGFQLGPAQPFGPHGQLFFPAVIRRTV